MIIDGKELAHAITEDLRRKVSRLKKKPGLAVIMVGSNPASKVYVTRKAIKSAEMGYYWEQHHLSKQTSQAKVITLIQKLNRSPKIHGILVQSPLPAHLHEWEIFDAIDPRKDVDGFHPMNVGKLMSGGAFRETPVLIPCTPQGVMSLIESTGISLAGKHAVVVGRSNIVGKPTAMLLLARDATVTICHSQTRNLKHYTQQADILVVAVGKPKMIKANMVKKSAVVIDVGITRQGKKILGDVDFEHVKKVAAFITPVPGGVGPMTVAMLMKNTFEAYQKITRRAG